MLELFVGGKLVQFGNKLTDLTLLLDVSNRDICPYHSWVISTDSIKIDVSRYDPSCKLITKDIHYFDGKYNNIFRICNGLGVKLFSIPEFDYELDLYTINKWIDELKTYNIEDIEIAKFIANTRNLLIICSILQYCSKEIANETIIILKLSYTVTETESGFVITEHSWCLGEPMEISRTIKRVL